MAKILYFFIITFIIGALSNSFTSSKPIQNEISANTTSIQSHCQEIAKDKDGNDVCLGNVYESLVEYKCLFCNKLRKCKPGFMKDRKGNCRNVLV